MRSGFALSVGSQVAGSAVEIVVHRLQRGSPSGLAAKSATRARAFLLGACSPAVSETSAMDQRLEGRGTGGRSFAAAGFAPASSRSCTASTSRSPAATAIAVRPWPSRSSRSHALTAPLRQWITRREAPGSCAGPACRTTPPGETAIACTLPGVATTTIGGRLAMGAVPGDCGGGCQDTLASARAMTKSRANGCEITCSDATNESSLCFARNASASVSLPRSSSTRCLSYLSRAIDRASASIAADRLARFAAVRALQCGSAQRSAPAKFSR